MMNNPWQDMEKNSQRRISAEAVSDIFWIVNSNGQYGFYFRTSTSFDDTGLITTLKGITTVKQNTDDGGGEIYLFLIDKDDWELFKILCEDLASTAIQCGKDEDVIDAIEIRLRRWQLLLKREIQRTLTLEVQMGLFSELLCMQEIIASIAGYRQAVSSWVGPAYDKQDFLLENSAVEVKSYRTSRGPSVEISSAQQLSSEKENLYLITYGLTVAENGLTVTDLAQSISAVLATEPVQISELFESKLMKYGYAPELIKEPLIKFKVDKNRAYLVEEDFPKIKPQDIKKQITSVKYSIDLTQCAEYQVELESITV